MAEPDPPALRRLDPPPVDDLSFMGYMAFRMQVVRIFLNRIFEITLSDIDRDIAFAESLDAVEELASNETQTWDVLANAAKWQTIQDWTLGLDRLFKKRYGSDHDQLRLVAKVFGIERAAMSKSDIVTRMEWYKRRIAKDFERSVVSRVEDRSIVSPIEQIFLMEWEYLRVEQQLGVKLSPQHNVTVNGREYSIDFVVTKPGLALNLAIELDGHDFHEKTKEQAKHDKARERTLVLAHFTVIQFTGSEIYNNSRRCVEEVVEIIKTRK